MRPLPLLSVGPEAQVASYRGAPMSAAHLAAQAAALARALPQAAHAINLAENRYHFLLGWIAACLRQQVTLLPPAHTDDVLTDLRRRYPDHHTLDDARIGQSLRQTPADAEFVRWTLPEDRVVAIAFTSGSTGEPRPHPKTWGSVFHNSRLAAAEVVGGANQGVVATVPPQHMYGLEASLAGALTAGQRLHDGKPFFPADVRAALEGMPGPRTLVTTPAHLRVLVEAGVELPALERVVSATAPLPAELAAQAERRWNTQVLEIYGCTEAGVMAHRRTTQSECWRTFSGGTMTALLDAAEYRAPQLAGPAPLPDLVESRSATEFFLRGRAADMIKVAGKRTSLQELTRQLLAVPGVEDAAVFVPEADGRPAAAVVAPGLTSAAILAVLRARLEGVFVPRPLVLVDRLPRNAVGKLPREALLQLLVRDE
jgi:acyl-coenzyme A synthetase/AMP-(fatty) acid ligase